MIRYIICQYWDGYMPYGKAYAMRCPFPVEIGDHLLLANGHCVVVIEEDIESSRRYMVRKRGYWTAPKILGRFPGKFEDSKLSKKQMAKWLAEHQLKETDGRLRKNRKGKKLDEEEEQ